MNRRRRLVGLPAAATVLAAFLGTASSTEAQLAFPPPVSIHVPVSPAPVRAMDHSYLLYELHVTNYAPVDLALRRVDVFLDNDTVPLVSYEGEALRAALLQPAASAGVEAGVVRVGGFEVVYLLVELEDPARPESLRHVVAVEGTGEQPMQGTIESRITVARARAVLRLGPPLRGGPWVMAHGFDNVNGHRRIVLPIEGRASIPQRYAIDYFKVDEQGKTFVGNEENWQNYHAYGEEVLAVADGVVAVAVDGIPENISHPYERAVPINLETVAGNHVLLELADGRYGFYAHLANGSVAVRPGDVVTKGQVIGRLGNTGNTPQPHLHFTIADNTGILANEGLPYEFEAFDVVGQCDAELETWGWFETCAFTEPDPRHDEIPLSWKLVRFRE